MPVGATVGQGPYNMNYDAQLNLFVNVAAGSVGVSGPVTVVQPTGSNLHAVIDSGSVTATVAEGGDDRTVRQAIDEVQLILTDIRDGIFNLTQAFSNISLPVTVSNPTTIPAFPSALAVNNLPSVQQVQIVEGGYDRTVRNLFEDMVVSLHELKMLQPASVGSGVGLGDCN